MSGGADEAAAEAATLRALAIEELSAEQAAAELAALSTELAAHDLAYHQDDAPVVDDATYDALKRRNALIEARFPELKRPDSPSERVGASPSSGFNKIAHRPHMTSLNNAFGEAEMRESVASIRKYLSELHSPSLDLQMFAEPKIDGLSVALRYRNGTLIRGITRGNGEYGEDVTENVKAIRDIPHQIDLPDQILEVRGRYIWNDKLFNK